MSDRLVFIEGLDKDYAISEDDLEPIAGLFYLLGCFDLIGQYDFWYS